MIISFNYNKNIISIINLLFYITINLTKDFYNNLNNFNYYIIII